jgi:hypothetical protein
VQFKLEIAHNPLPIFKQVKEPPVHQYIEGTPKRKKVESATEVIKVSVTMTDHQR